MKENSGITLIALVVTVIVLIILAGISFGALKGEKGIIKETYNATDQAQRESIIQKIEAELYQEKTISGEVPNKEKLKEIIQNKGYNDGELGEDSFVTKDGGYEIQYSEILGWENRISDILEVGDYVDYTYDEAEDYKLESKYSGTDNLQKIPQEKDMKWRVLNINDDGSVDLVSESSTKTLMNLKGTVGYNNGVYILNDICEKQYSNTKLGITARSINIEDYEKNLTEQGEKTRADYVEGSTNVQYGKTKKYEIKASYYPKLYEKENGSGINSDTTKQDGISQSDDGYRQLTTEAQGKADISGLTVTQTLYSIFVTEENFNNISSLLSVSSTSDIFWIASRFITCQPNYAGFGLLRGGNTIGGFSNYISTSFGATEYGNLIRPIVPLNSNIQITGGRGTSDEPYTIQ